jgi:hypothetical protein
MEEPFTLSLVAHFIRDVSKELLLKNDEIELEYSLDDIKEEI